MPISVNLLIAIAAVFLAIPVAVHACVWLYDRFRPKGNGAVPSQSKSPWRWSLAIFNIIGVALIGLIIARTWFIPPPPEPEPAQAQLDAYAAPFKAQLEAMTKNRDALGLQNEQLRKMIPSTTVLPPPPLPAQKYTAYGIEEREKALDTFEANLNGPIQYSVPIWS